MYWAAGVRMTDGGVLSAEKNARPRERGFSGNPGLHLCVYVPVTAMGPEVMNHGVGARNVTHQHAMYQTAQLQHTCYRHVHASIGT